VTKWRFNEKDQLKLTPTVMLGKIHTCCISSLVYYSSYSKIIEIRQVSFLAYFFKDKAIVD